MEGRLNTQAATIQKLMDDVEAIRQENVALRRGSEELEGDQQSHNSEARQTVDAVAEREERRRVDLQIQNL